MCLVTYHLWFAVDFIAEFVAVTVDQWSKAKNSKIWLNWQSNQKAGCISPRSKSLLTAVKCLLWICPGRRWVSSHQSVS